MGVVARSERDKYSGWPPPKRAELPVEPAETVQDAPKRRGRPPKVKVYGDNS